MEAIALPETTNTTTKAKKHITTASSIQVKLYREDVKKELGKR